MWRVWRGAKAVPWRAWRGRRQLARVAGRGGGARGRVWRGDGARTMNQLARRPRASQNSIPTTVLHSTRRDLQLRRQRAPPQIRDRVRRGRARARATAEAARASGERAAASTTCQPSASPACTVAWRAILASIPIKLGRTNTARIVLCVPPAPPPSLIGQLPAVREEIAPSSALHSYTIPSTPCNPFERKFHTHKRLGCAIS